MTETADEDIEALTQSVADVLGRECSMEAVQRYAGGDRELDAGLRRIASGLGWCGVAASEPSGSSGMGFPALAAIYESLGAHLCPLPFLPQQMAIQAMEAMGLQDDPRTRALVAGETWAATPPLARPLAIERTSGAITLTQAAWTLGDPSGSLLLLPVVDETGEAFVYLLEGAGAEPLEVHDQTRALARLPAGPIAAPEGGMIASGPAAQCLHDALAEHAVLALAADSVGGARTALSVTVAYLSFRQQFGRLIGSFQALKHRAATMKVRLEGARALVAAAVELRQAGDSSASTYASLAKARACDAYLAIASEAIQLHGGIGFTREGAVHMFLKRAKLSQQMFGDTAWHLDRASRLRASA